MAKVRLSVTRFRRWPNVRNDEPCMVWLMKDVKNTEGAVQYLNPDGMHKNPAYSQAVVVSGAAKTIYVGGQNAVDASGAIIGKGDLKAQTEQVFKNLQLALEASGAQLENIVKWNVYVVQGQQMKQGF